MSDSEFFIILIAAMLPTLLVISVLVLTAIYFIRRPEVGPEVARQEIKRSAILMAILVPLAFIIAFLFVSFFINYSDQNTIETILFAFIALIVLFLIAYPVYWKHKFDGATKSELFQVPIEASRLIPFVGITWFFLGIVRFVLFFVSDNPIELLLGLSQIILALYFSAIWYRPTWHITEEGIFTILSAIKWGMIVEQEWQPKSEKEVLFRCKVKRWWLPFKMPMNQVIPVEYERPLKAIIKKHITPEATTPPLSGIS